LLDGCAVRIAILAGPAIVALFRVFWVSGVCADEPITAVGMPTEPASSSGTVVGVVIIFAVVAFFTGFNIDDSVATLQI